MSSIYEDELKRLIKKNMAQIRLLSKDNKKSKNLKLLKDNVQELKNELKHFEKALTHFRTKPVPSPSSSS